MTLPVTGIDVSAWQPRIDWRQVAGAGHAFAFIKATEGSGYVSKRWREQWEGARAAGLLRGPYHFARWETPGDPADDARAEACHFFETVGPLGPGDLPPALDLEWVTDAKRDPDELVLWARTFLEECERLFGRWPLLYTGPSFWRYCLLPDKRDLSLELTSWPLWVVDYTPGAKAPKPMKDAPDWRWSFWQWTGHGSCRGIEGRCDLNYFRGTLGELQALAGLSPQIGAMP